MDKTRAIPGVKSVAVTGFVPFNGQDGSGTYRLLDRPLGPADPLLHAFQHTVGGDYFKTFEIPLLAGRVFNDAHERFDVGFEANALRAFACVGGANCR